MNNSIYNEEEESDESLRPKSAKRIKLDHDNNSSSSCSNSNELITTTTTTTTTIATANQNEKTTTSTAETTDQSIIKTLNQNKDNEEEEEDKQFTKEELLEYFTNELNIKIKSYVDNLLELFFLDDNGNFTEYFIWRKKPPTIPLLQYFKSIANDDEQEFENLQLIKASLDGLDSYSFKIVPISSIPSIPTINETQQQLLLPSTINNKTTIGSSSNLLNQQNQLSLNQTQSSLSAIASSSTSITSLSSTSLLHQQQQQQHQHQTDNNSSIHSNLNTPITPATTSTTTLSSLINSSKSNVNINQPHSSSTSSLSLSLSKNVINNSTFNTPLSPYHHSSSTLSLSSSSSNNNINNNNNNNNNKIAQFTKSPSLPSTPINSSSNNSAIISTKKSSRFHHTITLPNNNLISPNLSSSSPFSTPTTANISNVFESTIGSKEQTVERAKAEIQIIQRVNELRKEGLWTCKRLPKIQEPQRVKAHWDYLLEEMAWLAEDFDRERKWKKTAAKKFARVIMKYHSDKDSQVEKAEKENQLRLKKIASTISKEVRLFWSSVEKLVEFKIQTKLEEKRKQALDSHLNFIVGQTEKYTEWLAEGLNSSSSADKNLSSSKIEEQQKANEEEEEKSKEENKNKNDDEEFNLTSDDEEDFEDTIAEQEKHENKQNNALELKDLEDEANIPIEELLERYKDIYENEENMDIDEEESDINDEEEEEENEINDDEENDDEGLTTDRKSVV